VAATLQFTGEPFGDVVPVLDGDDFGTVTDTATIEVLGVEGADLTLADQATASSSIFGDTEFGVVVEDIQQATLEPQDVADPSDDFVVLFEGDELDPDAIVDFERISEADEDGTLVFDLTDEDISPGQHTVEIHADDGTGAPDPTQPRGAAETATVFSSTLTFEDQTIEEPVEEGDVLATLDTADLLDGAGDDTAFVVDVHPTDDEGNLVGTEFVGSSDVLSGANGGVNITAEQVPGDGSFNEFPIEETDDYVAMVHLVDDGSEPGDGASPGEYPVLPNADATDGFVAGGVTDDATITADIPGTISGEITLDEVDPDEDVNVTVELEETDDSTTVTLEGAETSANYTLDGLDEGEYTVTASEDTGNYADPDDVADVVVEDGETTVVDFAFERLTGGADGTVVASGETSTDQTPGPWRGYRGRDHRRVRVPGQRGRRADVHVRGRDRRDGRVRGADRHVPGR